MIFDAKADPSMGRIKITTFLKKPAMLKKQDDTAVDFLKIFISLYLFSFSLPFVDCKNFNINNFKNNNIFSSLALLICEI